MTEEPEKTSINIAKSHRRTRKENCINTRDNTSFLVRHRKTTANLKTKKPIMNFSSFFL